MRRINPGRATAGPGTTDEDPLPEWALTANWYWGCYVRWKADRVQARSVSDVHLGSVDDAYQRSRWPGGSPEIRATLDTATADLVNKHGIVPMQRRWELQAWLEDVVSGYFDLHEAINRELTEKETQLPLGGL